MRAGMWVICISLLMLGCAGEPTVTPMVEPPPPENGSYTDSLEIDDAGSVDLPETLEFHSYERLREEFDGAFYQLEEPPTVYEVAGYEVTEETGLVVVEYTYPRLVWISFELACWQPGFAPTTPLAPADAIEETAVGRYAVGGWHLDIDLVAALDEASPGDTLETPFVWDDSVEMQWLRWQQQEQICELRAPLWDADETGDRVLTKADLVSLAADIMRDETSDS